jgi:hypothetical protein
MSVVMSTQSPIRGLNEEILLRKCSKGQGRRVVNLLTSST